MTTAKTGVDDYTAHGADRQALEDLPTLAYTPTMADDAYHGLAGRIVRAIEPHSEADPVALLMHLLVAGGNLVGRGPHTMVEETMHTCGEYAAFVGRSSKGRKGQAWSTPYALLAQADRAWATTRVKGGLSSGEGVIYNVRDAREEHQPIKEHGRVVDYQRVVVDEGVADKRLLIFEPEFASVLERMKREGNSLSSVIRDGWDRGVLGTLVRNSPLTATGAHLSIIAHITRDELIASLTSTDRANGFANRFLFLLVKRAQVLPEPERVPGPLLAPLAEALGRVVTWAGAPRCLRRDHDARALWATVYPELSEGEPGLIGAVLGRAEAHVLRLSLIYATFDQSPAVRVEHLRAALAVWDYAEASARRIFGDTLGLTAADLLLAALRAKGPMTLEEIHALFHRHKDAEEIRALLRLLLEQGKVRRTTRPPEGGKGRPAEVWEAVA